MGLFKCLDKRYWRKFLYIVGSFMLICIVLVTSSCSSSKYSDDKNVEKFCENVVDNSYQDAITDEALSFILFLHLSNMYCNPT